MNDHSKRRPISHFHDCISDDPFKHMTGWHDRNGWYDSSWKVRVIIDARSFRGLGKRPSDLRIFLIISMGQKEQGEGYGGDNQLDRQNQITSLKYLPFKEWARWFYFGISEGFSEIIFRISN